MRKKYICVEKKNQSKGWKKKSSYSLNKSKLFMCINNRLGWIRKNSNIFEFSAAADTKKKAPPKNKATTNYEDIDFSNLARSSQGKEWNFKIASWNVDGVRAWMGKGGLDFIKYEKPDILCLQELKCGQDKLPDEIANLPGYHAYWLASDKDGYAGVGIYTAQLAISVQYGLQNEELDTEGRIITAEYEQFYLICTYVPNAGRKLITLSKRLQWNEEFRKHVQQLDKKKPVIICGDMNVAHNEIGKIFLLILFCKLIWVMTTIE